MIAVTIFAMAMGFSELMQDTVCTVADNFTGIIIAVLYLGKKSVGVFVSSALSVSLFTFAHFASLPASLCIFGAAVFYTLIYCLTGNLVYTIAAHALNNLFGTSASPLIEDFISAETTAELVHPYLFVVIAGMIISAFSMIIILKKLKVRCRIQEKHYKILVGSDILNFSETAGDFLVKLRMDSTFSTDDYEKIKSFLSDKVYEWKKAGSVPVEYVVDIVFLIDQLAGGSRFFDDETALKVEDACLEIEDIINNLI